ncbi:4685_t:CDS:2, partial [Paraglomus occultum]
ILNCLIQCIDFAPKSILDDPRTASGGPYDALGRRGNMAAQPKSVTGGGSSSAIRTGMSKRPQGAGRTGGASLHAPIPSSGRLSASGMNDPVQSSAAVLELTKKLEEVNATVDGLERERDFYFGKLRDIEILVQQQIEGDPDNAFLKEVQDILYSTEDGFEVPPEAGGGEFEDETF